MGWLLLALFLLGVQLVLVTMYHLRDAARLLDAADEKDSFYNYEDEWEDD